MNSQGRAVGSETTAKEIVRKLKASDTKVFTSTIKSLSLPWNERLLHKKKIPLFLCHLTKKK